MAGMLYLVPTPIGNLSDISPRCRQTLAEADFIAAEDTRVSLKLLNHLELKKSLVSYHEHNKAESGEKILARLLAGETCALVTDAGSPAISDPGEDLVRLCAEARRDGLRHSRPVRAGDGAEHLRAADGPVHVRGLSVRQQKKPSGAPDGLEGRDADDDLLRGAAQAAAPRCRILPRRSARSGEFPCAGS